MICKFNDCFKLKDLYCFAKAVPSANSDAFSNHISNTTLHVPAESIDAYSSTDPWSGFDSIVALTREEKTAIGI